MTSDKDLARRLADLTPEKRSQLQQILSKGRSVELGPRDPGARVPLAYGQERLWVLADINPLSAAYNETNSLRFQFPLKSDVLHRAIDEIVRRHEILRTRFDVADGEPFQSISAPFSVPVPVVDLRHLPLPERESAALRLAVEQSSKPFDIARGPLLRCALYRLDLCDWLFVLTMHHLICDGWSMGVFMVELMTLYWSFVEGKPSPLLELPIQFGDYAIWQRRALRETSRQAQLEYWKTQLRDLPTLDFPADHPRPPEFSFRGGRVPIAIDASTFDAAAALASKENVTLFMVMFAVFVTLLHRYTDQDDIVVGTPSGGRIQKSLEPLIGFFINTVILRVGVSGDPTFKEVLHRVRDTSAAAFANQLVPFEMLIDELQPPRDKSRNPLFQITFQLFSKPSTAGLATEALLPFIPVDCGISKFDLSMDLIANDGRIHGHLEYNKDLFNAGRIQRMAGHFSELLKHALHDPSIRISQLHLMGPEEEQQLLAWGQHVAAYPRNETIPSLVKKQVHRRPDAIAVRFQDSTLTYGELWTRAEAVAWDLRSLGVKAGDRVLVHMDRGFEFVPAILGVLLVRAAYVPVDPGYPEERVAHIVGDCGASTTLSAGTPSHAEPPETLDVGDSDPLDIAYLMYTSGTTGFPKGVAVTHRNILRLVTGVQYVTLNAEQKVLQVAPTSFDASTFEIWGALLNGASLEIYPAGVPVLEELAAFIKERAISLMFITTALFRQLVANHSSDLRGVKQLITGGEELMPDDAQNAWTKLPHTRLFNAYGPTECTTFSTMYPIGRTETTVSKVPIGKPIENTDAYIRDGYGNLTPIGIPGELCIGGDGVAAGYWRADQLSAEKFVVNPFRANDRMYRTGDIACFREDGNLLFLGRRDRQVKVSGYRIEIGEVEAAISRNPAVRAVAVVVRGSKDKKLEAYCEVQPGETLSLPALREFLLKSLPLYMVPTRLAVLDQLPLTPNGKIDAAVLLKGTPEVKRTAVSPRNDVEKAIAVIWAELLGVHDPSVTEDFFQLGGQSLIATRLISRIRAAFNKTITMREFFDNPTIEGLAHRVSPDALPQMMGAAGAE